MSVKEARVYQFKITLERIRPPVWRRIQVPESYTFWDLHVAIQDAMGWTDDHLHSFGIRNDLGRVVSIGIPADDIFYADELPGWKVPIKDFFTEKNKKARYVYDFGDNWVHRVVLEKILPADPGTNYPVCIGGRRACPPEDCGGVWGYAHLLEALSDPNHPEHEDVLEWVGDSFDPESFDPAEVEFDDPRERWHAAFGR